MIELKNLVDRKFNFPFKIKDNLIYFYAHPIIVEFRKFVYETEQRYLSSREVHNLFKSLSGYQFLHLQTRIKKKGIRCVVFNFDLISVEFKKFIEKFGTKE